MKLAITPKDLTMHGMGERVKFTVRADSHIMKVLSNLYEYPEKAMLREYLTNMYDAYVALTLKNPDADFVQPVLMLPTSLSPFLEFRDYGIGMSVQTVMEVYTQYGNSTKNDNNVEVGGFGLGSKTAFCYNHGQTWFIETRWEGKKHVFAAFLDEKQIPTLSPVSTEDTTEHNGVTVKVPILRKDIESVHEAAKEYVPYFPLALTVENLDIPALEYSVKTDTWALLKKSRHDYGREINVIIGSVPYVFDLDVLDGVKDYPAGLPFGAIDLFLPVGSVDIVPSRDSLQVTDRTKGAVRRGIAKMIQELPAAVTDTVKQQANVQDAAKALQNVLTLFSFEYSINKGQTAARKFADAFMAVTWNDISLMGYIDYKTDGYAQENRDFFVGAATDMNAPAIKENLVGVFGRLSRFGSGIAQIDSSGMNSIVINNENTFVMLNDRVRGPIRIARSYIDSKIIHRNPSTGRMIRYGHRVGYVILLDGDTLSAADVAKLFNIPESWVLLTSQLKGTLKLTSAANNSVDNIYRWYNTRWVSRVRIPDPANGPYYYLPLKKDGARWENPTFGQNGVKQLIEAGNVNELYGIKESDTADLDDTVWINLETMIRKNVMDSLNNNLASWITPRTMGFNAETPFTEVIQLVGWSTNDADIKTYLAEYNKTLSAMKASGNMNSLPYAESLLNILDIDWRSRVAKQQYFDFEKAEKNILAKHPMIRMITEIINNRYTYRGWGKLLAPHKQLILDSLK